MKKNSSTLKGKTVLIVNTGWAQKRFILERVKELGVKIVMLNKEKNWASDLVDFWILADTDNHAECLQAVRQFISKHPEVHIDGALTFWDPNIVLTSKIIDRFDFIGIPTEVARLAKNKFRFRDFCAKNGIKTPKFKKTDSLSDLEDAVKSLKFPLVLKPVYGAHSAFVVKVEEKKELAKTYKYIKSNIHSEVDLTSDGFDVYVEEYIDGEEIDIDILVQNGKTKFVGISDNAKTEEPFFVETGRTTPSALPETVQEQIKQFADEVLEKMGVQNGCIHFEAKWTKDGAYPIEVNLRLGGDEIYTSVKNVWGVDLIEGALKIALGEFIKPCDGEKPLTYMNSISFVPDGSGVVIELDIDEKALKKLKFVDQKQFFYKIGDPILVPPEGFDYLGWLTVKGDNHVAAQENLKEAISHIKFRVAKYQSTSSVGKTYRDTAFAAASVARRKVRGEAKYRKLQLLSEVSELPSLKIGILYDDSTKGDGTFYSPETHSMLVAADVSNALESKGHKVILYDINDLVNTFYRLQYDEVDLVFNLCEEINSSNLLEPHSAALLDILEIPYTGSSALALSLSMDKIKAKKLLEYHNIPTAKFDYIFQPDDKIKPDLKYPLIIKPVNTNKSVGITNDSVVRDEEELRRQVKKLIRETQRPVLLEEYIEGYELDIGLIGNGKDVKALPISRTTFDKLPRGYWGIYPFEAKWGLNTVYDKYLQVERPAKLEPNQAKIVSEIAIDVYNMLDCHDYGRVEMRMDREGNFYVIELNANPSLLKDGYFGNAAPVVGMEYADMIENIVKATIARYMNKPPYHHLQSVLTVYDPA